jgi:hypothetical protein
MVSSSSSAASSSVRRRTVSSAASRPQHIAEIKPILDSLDASASDPDILTRLQWLSLLKRVLVDSPEAKGLLPSSPPSTAPKALRVVTEPLPRYVSSLERLWGPAFDPKFFIGLL